MPNIVTPGFHRHIFEWTVELMSVERNSERRSNVFSFKGHEVHLRFTYVTKYRIYCVQLRAPPSFPSCGTHIMTVRVETKNKMPLSLPNNYDITPECKMIWYYKEQEILEVYPDFLEDRVLTFLVSDVDPPEQAIASDVKLMNLDSLSSDFRDLLASGEASSDVQLNCKGIARPVHRAVLAARSQVFSAMFRNKMAEGDSGAVDFSDLDVDVLDLFLQYLYSGKLPNIPEDKMHELYVLAHKYAVHGLKIMCSDWMVEKLSADNCTTFLLTADDHSDAELKNALIESIVDHSEWLGTAMWLEFPKEHPILAIEVYQKYYYDNTKSFH